MDSFMDLSVRFRWSGDAAADLISLVTRFCDPSRFGPVTTNDETTVKASALTQGEHVYTQLDRYASAERQIDEWFRTGNGDEFELTDRSARGGVGFTVAVRRGQAGSEFGSLHWLVPEHPLYVASVFARELTDFLAQVCELVPTYQGGCSSPHGHMFGSYASIANPRSVIDVVDDELVDHDWQIVVPPLAVAKLDLEALTAAAESGEIRQVDWWDGRAGLVARVCDDPSAMTDPQWSDWREALQPALVEHERVVRERSDPRPPHIDSADWTAMTEEALQAKRQSRMRELRAGAMTSSTSPVEVELVLPEQMPTVEESAATIRELMERPDAPYQAGYGLSSLAATPLAFSDFQKWAFDYPLATETETFLTTEIPLPWNPGTIHYSKANPPGVFAEIMLWGDGGDGFTHHLVHPHRRETAPIIESTVGHRGLVFPSLRSALWLWTVCLQRGLEVFDSPDHAGWETLEYAWWLVGSHMVDDGLPEVLQKSMAQGFRWLIDVEWRAGCFDGLDLIDLIAASRVWPSDWVDGTGLAG